MNRFRTFLLTTYLAFLSMVSVAQDVPAKIMAFNAVIGKQYNVSNKGNKLIIEGFREGKQVKTDKVNVFDLDLKTLSYSEKDRTVAIKCYSELDGCVQRILLLDKKKSYRKRMLFAVPDDVSGEEIVNALRSMLNDMTEKH